MLVKDIMLREVVTVSPFATIREAMRVMKQNKVKSLVVEKRDAHDAYGIITYTNILKTIVAEEGDIDLVNVYDICAKPALTISRELDVKHAARLMVNIGVRRLLVTSSNELAGIVT
ncbi:signal transduction protein, partial [Thauera sp. 27]